MAPGNGSESGLVTKVSYIIKRFAIKVDLDGLARRGGSESGFSIQVD